MESLLERCRMMKMERRYSMQNLGGLSEEGVTISMSRFSQDLKKRDAVGWLYNACDGYAVSIFLSSKYNN